MSLIDSLAAHVLVSFVIGGIGVGSATFASRRYHSGFGGLIGGLPTISAISFFFIGLGQSPNDASRATITFPLGMSFTFLFLLIYASLADYGFKIAITTGLAAWLGLSITEVYVHLENLTFSIVVVSSIFTASQYILKRKLRLTHTRGLGEGLSSRRFAEFAFPGGAVVAGAVFLGRTLGTTAGGVAAAFPGVFSLTLTFTYLSDGGMRLSRSMTKSLMVTAFIVAFPYSVFVGLLYPSVGIWLGTIIAAVVDLPLAFLAYLLNGMKEPESPSQSKIHRNRLSTGSHTRGLGWNTKKTGRSRSRESHRRVPSSDL